MDKKTFSTDRPIGVYYALLSDITLFNQTDTTHCTVSVKNDWKLIHTTIGTINFREVEDETRAGIKHVTELTAICPGHDSEILEEIENNSGKKVILKITYREGSAKIIGTPQSGPKLRFDTNSENSTERRLKVTWEHTARNLYED